MGLVRFFVQLRWITIGIVISTCIVLFIYHSQSTYTKNHPGLTDPRLSLQQSGDLHHEDYTPNSIAQVNYTAGFVKAVGEPYLKRLVVPRSKKEDVGWIEEHFGGDPWVEAAVYETDEGVVEGLRVPKNKGHEVMVYLSYIIDRYEDLADVNVFVHSHRWAWHNNELLGNDAVEIISRLSSERVQREGFMNMRCHWEPGCPGWLHPGAVEEDLSKQEETLIAKTWLELFPHDPIPNVLAQPCCGQFAISRDRIRSLPLETYIYYRDWLMETHLSDYISGRIWEYVWQFVFTGENVVCPKEHVCYCDGFGVCFGGEEEYEAYWVKNRERVKLEKELKEWKQENERRKRVLEVERNLEMEMSFLDDVGRDMELEGRIRSLLAWAEKRRSLSKERGDVARNRALEAGRTWRGGDGF